MDIEVTCFNCGTSAKLSTKDINVQVSGEKGDMRISWVDVKKQCHFAFIKGIEKEAD